MRDTVSIKTIEASMKTGMSQRKLAMVLSSHLPLAANLAQQTSKNMKYYQ